VGMISEGCECCLRELVVEVIRAFPYDFTALVDRMQTFKDICNTFVGEE